MMQTIDKFFLKLKENQVKRSEKLVRKLEKNCEDSKAAIQKLTEKLLKGVEKTCEQGKLQVLNYENAFEKDLRNARREILKTLEIKEEPIQEGPWYPQEIDNPREFLKRFLLETNRMDFIVYFLEATMGKQFRGDRNLTVWQKVNGKYISANFEDVMEWMTVLEHQRSLCFENPFDYMSVEEIEENTEFFRRLDEIYLDTDIDLTPQNLRKFLIYTHKSLPPLRRF